MPLPTTSLPLRPPQAHAAPLSQRIPNWLLGLLLGGVLPLLIYGLLPLVHINALGQLFSINRLFLLPAALIGILAAGQFLDFCRYKNPIAVVCFLVVFWQIVAYLTDLLLVTVGINVHLRPLLLIAYSVPALIAWSRNYRHILQDIPFLKYFLIFFGVVLFYRLFFNANAMDVKSAIEGAAMSGNMANDKLLFYLLSLMGISICYSAFAGKWPHNQQAQAQLFDRLNQALLLVTAILSVIFVVGYPLNQFTVKLEGFTRSAGFLSQPNPFAHHMGILLLYFCGLFCYYQGVNKNRMPAWLIYTALLSSLLAFLVGFSKTAILALVVCVPIIFIGSFSIPGMRVKSLWSAILIGVFVVVGLGLFSYFSHQSIIEILNARMENNNSMDWRTNVWNYLLSDLSFSSLFTGHGHTASNAFILQNSFSDKEGKPVIMVHNGYLELIYDYGIWGYVFFLALLSAVWHAFKASLQPMNIHLKPLLYTIFAMTLYFLVVLSNDEMLFMFDATYLYWYLCTILLVLKQPAGGVSA